MSSNLYQSTLDGSRLPDKSSTFVDNMSLPIHRWFRYSAGFSSEWVMSVVKQHNSLSYPIHVMDPFAGSGTTLLSCDQLGVCSTGFESHPLISEIASTKLLWGTNVERISALSQKIISGMDNEAELDEYPPVVYKCYSTESLKTIDALKKSLYSLDDGSDEYRLCKLAFISILRKTSHVGTAQWQYLLPNKTKSHVLEPLDAFNKQIELMISDMKFAQKYYPGKSKATLVCQDSRKYLSGLDDSVDLIITSPPYANNYDYADSTRLELSILGDIKEWKDLQSTIRPNLVRSCSQHVSKDRKDTYNYLKDPLLSSIYSEILEVCETLDVVKESHGGKKNYHTMVALYFYDLAKVWVNLRKYCKTGSDVCFVVGDSAPYGVYVPVDVWLGELAKAAGFTDYRFIKTRDRNVKWKNRKHDVPLKEGQLWVKG